jgi:SUN domain-containing protein 1/2
VSDSEGEGERPATNGRGKSPFEEVFDSAKRALAPVSFYLQQKLQGPGEPSFEETSTASANDKEASYDYAAEEQEFQASQQARNAKNQAHKRGRISVDNKAYKPPVSDPESSEEDEEGDDKTKKRRKKKKKDTIGGLLNQLPVITHDKRRKKKSRGSKQNIGGEDEESDSEENTDTVISFSPDI